MAHLAAGLRVVAHLIQPFMMTTSDAIMAQLGMEKVSSLEDLDFAELPAGLKVVAKGTPIFPRLDMEEEITYIKDQMGGHVAISQEEEKEWNPAEVELKNEKTAIKFEAFDAVEIRVAEVKAVKKVEGSDKLLQFRLDAGDGKDRQILSGIANYYPNEQELIGLKVQIVANLKPRKMMGLLSQGMILSAEHQGNLTLLTVDPSVPDDLDAKLGQIADVLVNETLALEIQCSSLPIQRLQERTKAYHEKGFEVLWLLGKKLWLKERLTSLQKQFLRFSQNMGFYLWELDLDKQILRLRYLIHEDWHGRVQCLTKVYPFGQGKLLEIFRQPYTQQKVASFQGKLDSHLKSYIAQQLYYQSPKWMDMQAQAYEKGENLLTKSIDAFYPQIHLPESTIGFTQIRENLDCYYQDFFNYYKLQKNKQVQKLYSPAFYKEETQSIIGKKALL